MILAEAIERFPNTPMCVSLSSKPGIFGKTVHNAGYQSLGIDMIYVPCLADDIIQSMALIRKYSIVGCSLSMPFKECVIPFLDKLDESSLVTKSVNTIVNRNGILIGYNTDAYGAKMLLDHAAVSLFDSIVVLGTGGVANAVLHVLKEHQNVKVIGRNADKLSLISKSFLTGLWSDDIQCDVLINCTPIGMSGEKLPINKNKVEMLIDLIVNDSETVKEFRLENKPAYSGLFMALHQAYKQFELYTGCSAPQKAMIDSLNET